MSNRDYFLVTVDYDGPDGRAVVITEKVDSLPTFALLDALKSKGVPRVELHSLWNMYLRHGPESDYRSIPDYLR